MNYFKLSEKLSAPEFIRYSNLYDKVCTKVDNLKFSKYRTNPKMSLYLLILLNGIKTILKLNNFLDV